MSSDGKFAFCTRDAKAGSLELHAGADPPAYRHLLRGECRCGVEHNPADKPKAKSGRINVLYPYTDETGLVVFEVVRYAEPKGFKQRRPDGKGGYVWSLKGVRTYPWRLPELLQSSGPVFIVEGEKATDRLIAEGLAATTAPGGAGKWTEGLARWLKGRECIVIPDCDPPDKISGRRPGLEGAISTAQLLTQAGITCKLLELPEQPEDHSGADDWLDRGHTVAELVALAESAPVYVFAVEVQGKLVRPSAGIYTDTRNARRLVAKHGEEIRFDHTRGQWRLWDGRVWTHDETAGIMLMAKEVIADMHIEAEQTMFEDDLKRAQNKILACESTGRLNALVDNAKSDVTATHKTWDAEPYWLNCNNGTIDLRTGELLAHRPERWQSKLAPVDYDPDAKCPRWDAFLDRIFAGDQELIQFVQRAVGLSMVGEVVEHVLFLLWGTGGNGKSKFLEAIMAILGDYARTASPDLLLNADTPQHSTNIAELKGVRLVSAIETAEGKRMSEAVVKMLTGGDTRNARFLFQDAFTYIPSDTFWVATNTKPVVQGNSEGLWRRMKLIPFTVTIPKAEIDPELPKKLRAEYSGILAWAVRGCMDWQRQGLREPSAVSQATAHYRGEMDTLNAFLEEACVREEGSKVASEELYRRYVAWCQQAGEKVATQRFLGLRLGEHGFVKTRMTPTNRWGWQGLRLRGDNELFQPDQPTGQEAEEPEREMVLAGFADNGGAPTPDQFSSNDEYITALRRYWQERGNQ